MFFGLLVHQTIEEIHRLVMDGKLNTLTEPRIRELFDRTFAFLCLDGSPAAQRLIDRLIIASTIGSETTG